MGQQGNFYMHPEDEAEFIKSRCIDCKFLLRHHQPPVPESFILE